MHELSITSDLLNIALAKAGEAGAKKVKCVRIKVGEFTSVEPECIKHYFSNLTVGTIAEGADLSVKRVPLTARCTDCALPFAPESFSFKCPACGSSQVNIISGRELHVDSIVVI